MRGKNKDGVHSPSLARPHIHTHNPQRPRPHAAVGQRHVAAAAPLALRARVRDALRRGKNVRETGQRKTGGCLMHLSPPTPHHNTHTHNQQHKNKITGGRRRGSGRGGEGRQGPDGPALGLAGPPTRGGVRGRGGGGGGWWRRRQWWRAGEIDRVVMFFVYLCVSRLSIYMLRSLTDFISIPTQAAQQPQQPAGGGVAGGAAGAPPGARGRLEIVFNGLGALRGLRPPPLGGWMGDLCCVVLFDMYVCNKPSTGPTALHTNTLQINTNNTRKRTHTGAVFFLVCPHLLAALALRYLPPAAPAQQKNPFPDGFARNPFGWEVLTAPGTSVLGCPSGTVGGFLALSPPPPPLHSNPTHIPPTNPQQAPPGARPTPWGPAGPARPTTRTSPRAWGPRWPPRSCSGGPSPACGRCGCRCVRAWWHVLVCICLDVVGWRGRCLTFFCLCGPT